MVHHVKSLLFSINFRRDDFLAFLYWDVFSLSSVQETLMFDASLESAAQIIARHAPHHGVFPTLVPGLTLYRIESNAFIERTAGEIMTTFI